MTQERWMPTHLQVALFLFALIFLLYGNSLTFDYVLDDAQVWEQNSIVRQGIAGIPSHFVQEASAGVEETDAAMSNIRRYRPLSLSLFSLEHALFGLNPQAGHGINLLLFALLVFLIYRVLNRLFVRKNESWWLSLPILSSLLFVVHPIHTEVVCHIKGQEQLLMFVLIMASAWYWIDYHDTTSWKSLLLASICFFAALFARENALPFLLVFPVMIWLFREISVRQIVLATLPLSATALLWLLIRQTAIGTTEIAAIADVFHQTFLEASLSDRYATIFSVLGRYLFLLIFPHPLTHDYSPQQIEIISWNDISAILSAGSYLLLLLGAVLLFKRHKVLAFAILLFMIPLSLMSNLFVWIGSLMQERFVFESSLGFCLALAYALNRWGSSPLFEDSRRYKIALGALLLLFSFKTIDRSFAWKYEAILLLTDARVSASNARLSYEAGALFWEKAVKSHIKEEEKQRYLQEAKTWIKQSLGLYPNQVEGLILMGNLHWELHQNYDSTFACYRKAVILSPGHEVLYQNVQHLLNHHPELAFRLAMYESFAAVDPGSFVPHYELGMLYGKVKQNLYQAQKHLELAYQANPHHKEILKALGTLYGRQHQFQTSVNFFEKALQLDPDDPDIYQSLSVGYHFLGKVKKSARYKEKATGFYKMKHTNTVSEVSD